MPPNATLIGFVNADFEVPVTREALEREYSKCTNQPYPIHDIAFARSWMLFRVGLPLHMHSVDEPTLKRMHYSWL